ncbi:siderophore-interacting protein [Streptomyces sp. NPDC047014]|uniref:siderophore-interacting protein n=1 Tax=Streptomyces sp. NPDC047014 TaxID=3155736 RepID=UPI0033D7FDE1
MSSRNPRSVVTFPIVLRELTVLRVTDVTPGMRRLTLGGPQLGAFRKDGLDLPELSSEGFDDHVKFFFAEEGADAPVLPGQNVSSLDWPADARPLTKDYTPVRYDPAAGEIDFDFVNHAGGVASSWAQSAEPGDVTWIAGPKMSHRHPEGADWLLVIGDETALPAIGRWLAEMPEGTRARVFIEVGEESHRQELPTRADAEITWLVRDGAPAGTTDLLESAVRAMEWLPGTVFAWAAGESVTLKGIRRHLAVDRAVPREQTHITGYWRRTEAPAAKAPADTANTADTAAVLAAGTAEPEPEETDPHDRLHELTDLAPGLAIRAAVTVGLVDLVWQGARTAEELADLSGTDRRTLAALLAYLVELEVFSADADGYRLTPVGEELVEDDHSLEEYDLRGAHAALDLSLSGLHETLRTGRAGYRTASGAPLAVAMAADERLGASAREAVEDEALWIAPGVRTGYDWAAAGSVTLAGPGAGAVAGSLAAAFPELRVAVAGLPSALRTVADRVLETAVRDRVRLLPTSGPVPAGDRTVLLCRLLEQLPDEDAVLALRENAAAVGEGGALLLVEQVEGAEGIAVDTEAALHHLRLKAAFGSGVRTEGDFERLAALAGLRIGARRDIGWDHRMWELTAAR